MVENPDQQTKIDIAKEKALLYLYLNRKNSFRGYCWATDNNNSKKIAATGAALIAFEKNGHRESNDPIADVYQEVVSGGLSFLWTEAVYPDYLIEPPVNINEEVSTFTGNQSLQAHCLATLALIYGAPSPEVSSFQQQYIWWCGYYGETLESLVACLKYPQANYQFQPNRIDTGSDASTWGSLLWHLYQAKIAQLPDGVGSLRKSAIESPIPAYVSNTWMTYLASEPNPSGRELAGAYLGTEFFSQELVTKLDSIDGMLASVWANPGVNTVLSYENPTGWAGRMDSIFLIANAIEGRAGPNLGADRDCFSSLSSWLLGEPEVYKGSGMVIPEFDQVALPLRSIANAYGQSPAGYWRSDGMPGSENVISAPITCTGLGVSALTRTNIFPSATQKSSEYGVGFRINNPPALGSAVKIGSGNTPSIDVQDADGGDLIVNLFVSNSEFSTEVVKLGNSMNGVCSFLNLRGQVKPGDTVKIVVIDSAGKTVSAVLPVVDVEPPVIDPIADIAVNLGDTDNFVVVQKPTVTATDNSGFTPGVDIISWPANNKFYVGSTPVNVRAVDRFGNFSAKTFYVNVGDVSAPVIFQASDVYINSDPGRSYGTVPGNLIPSNPANDNSGLPPTIVVSGYGPNNQFPIGDNVITVTATDSSKNSSTMSFHVFVADREAPAVTLSTTRLLVSCDAGKDFATVPQTQLPKVTALDNSGKQPTVTVSGIPDQNLFPLGTTRVSVIAVDTAGNRVSTGYDVVVRDTEAPIVADIAPIIVNLFDSGNAASLVLQVPLTFDNVDVKSKKYYFNGQVYDAVSGSVTMTFPLGPNPVSYVATDYSENSTTNWFSVIVVDKVAPVVSPVAPITVTAALGKSNAPVTIPAFSASDNSGVFFRLVIVPNVSTNMFSGNVANCTFPIGSTSVRYVATDASGNSSYVTSTVTVRDVELPKFVYIPPVSVSSGAAGSVTLSNNDLVNKLWASGLKVTDNEGKTPTLTISSTVPSTFNKGTTTSIPITARDSSGNFTMSSFALRVL